MAYLRVLGSTVTKVKKNVYIIYRNMSSTTETPPIPLN